MLLFADEPQAVEYLSAAKLALEAAGYECTEPSKPVLGGPGCPKRSSIRTTATKEQVMETAGGVDCEPWGHHCYFPPQFQMG